jgi:hypothetical protein
VAGSTVACHRHRTDFVHFSGIKHPPAAVDRLLVVSISHLKNCCSPWCLPGFGHSRDRADAETGTMAEAAASTSGIVASFACIQ